MPEVRFEEITDGVLLTNDFVVVEVRLNTGTYSIHTTNQQVVDAAATVVTSDGSIFSTRGEELELAGTKYISDVHGSGTTAFLSRETDETEPEVHLLITVYENQPYVVVRAEVQDLSASPMRVQDLVGVPSIWWRITPSRALPRRCFPSTSAGRGCGRRYSSATRQMGCG